MGIFHEVLFFSRLHRDITLALRAIAFQMGKLLWVKLTRHNLLYAMMALILIIESFVLIYEKMKVSDDVLQGTYVIKDDLDGPLEYVYQYPPLSNLDASIGVLFIAHGCSHAATDFWPMFQYSCPKCRGLPVEKAIVLEALTRDYIVVAATASDTSSRCWSNTADIPRIIRVIEAIREQIKLPDNIPNFLIGASSGGSFVGALAVRMNQQAQSQQKPHLLVSGINIQISHIQREYWKQSIVEGGFMPAIHFVHMSRDSRTTGIIDDFLDKVKNMKNVLVVEDIDVNIETESIERINEQFTDSRWYSKYTKQLAAKKRGKEIQPLVMLRSIAKPRAITPEMLVYRDYKVIPSYRLARHLVQSFTADHVIDKNGMLIHDPRSNEVNWRDTVYRAIPDAIKQHGDALIADQSPIAELMNVAFAQHEFTDEFIQHTLDFFDLVSPFTLGDGSFSGQSMQEKD